MILRTHRFHGHNSLTFVYAKGSSFRASNMSLRVVLNQRRQAYRCAVVVSKKTSKSAVVRNRIRRRIFEQIRLNGEKIQKPWDIVVTVHSDQVAQVTSDELNTTLKKLLLQAGVLE